MVVTMVTLVPEPKPFLDANSLKPGSFTAITTSHCPWAPETVRRFDRIVVDDLEQERNMAKPMVDPAMVAGDLTGLVCGDLAVATLAYVRAQVAGVLGA